MKLRKDYLSQRYVAKMLEVAAEIGEPGKVILLDIAHDDWCPLLAGSGPCECEPDVSVRSTHMKSGAS